MSNKAKVLEIALAKLRPSHISGEWCACLSYAEAFALCKDGWKINLTNLYQPNHLKSFLAQGIGGRAWFYWSKIGHHKPKYFHEGTLSRHE